MISDEASNRIIGGYNATLEQIRVTRDQIAALRDHEQKLQRSLRDHEAAGRLFGIQFEPLSEVPAERNVREFVMRYAKEHAAGFRSSEITDAYETAFAHRLHPKTVGMTLYRLKDQGLVSRANHIWTLAAYTTTPTRGGAHD